MKHSFKKSWRPSEHSSGGSRSLGAIMYGTPQQRKAALMLLVHGAPGSDKETLMSFPGIHCSDRIPRTDDYEEIAPAFRLLNDTSIIIGGVNMNTQAMCAQWPWKAKEIYQGDFKAKTKHPLLILSNALDGLTPLVSARNMSSGFEGSVLLEIDALHTCRG